ncbi:MAG: hypothetical protein PF961_17885 [Planctomycetota bacterium]|jgi:hypothetical protein|nr:hypothetical protein [Planctomycetota bacterium]
MRVIPFAVVLVSLVLFGCSGGSKSDPFVRGAVTLTATVRYEAFVPMAVGGLDFDNPVMRPVPGAVLEVWTNRLRPELVATGNLNGAGVANLRVPAHTSLKLIVRAALGDRVAPNTTINQAQPGMGIGDVYEYETEFTTTDAAQGLDWDFDSGFVGDPVGFDDTAREAGPFAVLDGMYRAQQLVLTAAPSFQFTPSVAVRWGPDANEGSFYSPNAGFININGDQMADNDEYDTAIIIHEWAHYFEDNHGRSDSLGGAHAVFNNQADHLDDTVAFGEGWATAFAGMVLNHWTGDAAPFYRDTAVFSDANGTEAFGFRPVTYLDIGIEDNALANAGYWSEVSVLLLIYDLYDTANEGANDTLSLGFKPLFDIFVGPQRNTPAFTSVYSYLDALKNAQGNPNDAAIDAMALTENILAADNPFGPTAADTPPALYQHYIPFPLDETLVNRDPDNNVLATSERYYRGGNYWPGNKLFQRWMFQAEAGAGEGGLYTVLITPKGEVNDGALGRLVLFYPNGTPVYDPDPGDEYTGGGVAPWSEFSNADGEGIQFETTLRPGDNLVFAVGSKDDEVEFELSVTDFKAVTN